MPIEACHSSASSPSFISFTVSYCPHPKSRLVYTAFKCPTLRTELWKSQLHLPSFSGHGILPCARRSKHWLWSHSELHGKDGCTNGHRKYTGAPAVDLPQTGKGHFAGGEISDSLYPNDPGRSSVWAREGRMGRLLGTRKWAHTQLYHPQNVLGAEVQNLKRRVSWREGAWVGMADQPQSLFSEPQCTLNSVRTQWMYHIS